MSLHAKKESLLPEKCQASLALITINKVKVLRSLKNITDHFNEQKVKLTSYAKGID